LALIFEQDCDSPVFLLFQPAALVCPACLKSKKKATLFWVALVYGFIYLLLQNAAFPRQPNE